MHGKPTLYLIDVSSLFFRAYYAVRPLTSPQGLPVNAIFGYLTMVLKLLREEKPTYVALCFDRPEPSFRKEIDPNYKAHRAETPADLVPQIPWIRRLSEWLGVPCFDSPGYEADDVIGALAAKAERQEVNVVIVSGDKDFAQLVDDHITLFDPMSEARRDIQGVIEKWGIHPKQMIDYLSLVGDSSDNIPGVTGIGPKTAVTLLKQYQSIDGIYENLESIQSSATTNKLRLGKENAYLSRRLVRIATEVPLPTSIEDLRPSARREPEFRQALEELGFRALVKSLYGDGVASAPVAATSHQDVEVISERTPALSEVTREPAEILRELRARTDTWIVPDPSGLIVAQGETAHRFVGDPSLLRAWIEENHPTLCGFDLKETSRFLGLQNFQVACDLMLAEYVLTGTSVGSMQDFVKRSLADLPDFPTPGVLIAGFSDLRRKKEELLKEKQLNFIYRDIELPLIPILTGMESVGIKIDLAALANASEVLGSEIRTLTAMIYQAAGREFNVGSPKQLSHILFQELGLASSRKTKTGLSTDTDVLEKLRDKHPLPALIIEWRELSKLKSTYVDGIAPLADAQGRVHTSFNQAVTATGRLSSTHPNLQNIPIRTERGNQIRRAFIADQGCQFVACDYSQIELRILAHITQDEGLMWAFREGKDIHSATAAGIFHVDLKDVTSEMRRQAKAVNFGLAYGQGVFGLSENLGVSRSAAQEIIDNYFERFPGVKDYMESAIAQAREKGYVDTIYGRRRYLPELQAKNPQLRKFGERAAINAPMQGTASDIVKLAMIQVNKALSGTSWRTLLQVHDELVFEVPEEDLARTEIVRKTMEHAAELRVPLVVDVGQGPNWQAAST